jgi:hypothetical protein
MCLGADDTGNLAFKPSASNVPKYLITGPQCQVDKKALVAVNAVISARMCNEKRIENWPGIYRAVHVVNNYTVRLVEKHPCRQTIRRPLS